VSDLEDAIREHLELKRRRGADPSEVAREEHEALAPVTRSHPVVASLEPALEDDPHEYPAAPLTERASVVVEPPRRSAAPASDATQEFRVEFDHDWLSAGD
jgi:hypothetical protein